MVRLTIGDCRTGQRCAARARSQPSARPWLSTADSYHSLDSSVPLRQILPTPSLRETAPCSSPGLCGPRKYGAAVSSCTSCEGAPARAAHGEATKTSTEPATEMASKHGPPVSVGGAKSLKPGTQLWMQVRVDKLRRILELPDVHCCRGRFAIKFRQPGSALPLNF